MSRRNADPAASKGAVLTFFLSEFSRCVYPFRNEIIVVHLCWVILTILIVMLNISNCCNNIKNIFFEDSF